MSRKLTERDKENRLINLVLQRIYAIEKRYGRVLTQKACRRFAERRREESKLQKEIRNTEQKLAQLRKRIA